ncbi:MAG TPA: 50S ribosomal protein L32e [Thermoplasmatales archaeon]|nr:50S ribosomal protein L32e [Thermoplasmatales archaeon]
MKMKKEDVIKQFTSIEGIGKAKAEALYASGFTSMEALSKASVEELAQVKGITESLAERIKKQIKTEEKKEQPVKETEKMEETEEKEIEEKPEEEEVKEEEVEEKVYVAKPKPKLDEIKRRAFEIRKKKKEKEPEFRRQEWFRYKRIKECWRKPRGLHSKTRRNLKYRPPLVRIGFRGPKEARGLHPSGFEEVLVHTPKELDEVNPAYQAVRIGATVGTRKRLEIKTKAEELGIRILNRGDL